MPPSSMVEEAGRGLALGSPKTFTSQHRGERGFTEGQEVVRTDAREVEHTVAQGSILALPEVGDLHLWGHGQL